MVETEKPNWLKIKPADLEKIVLDLAREGKTYAEIGISLRDKHGIPKTKLLGKRISEIIRGSKVKVKEDPERVKEKVANLNNHIAKNKHDKKAKRSFIKQSWIVHKFDLAKKAE
jgi:small subunit ribosomal protein S15